MNPTFNESCVLKFDADHCGFDIWVYDKDLIGSDDFLGKISLNLDPDTVTEEEHSEAFVLEDKKGEVGDNGSLFISYFSSPDTEQVTKAPKTMLGALKSNVGGAVSKAKEIKDKAKTKAMDVGKKVKERSSTVRPSNGESTGRLVEVQVVAGRGKC